MHSVAEGERESIKIPAQIAGWPIELS